MVILAELRGGIFCSESLGEMQHAPVSAKLMWRNPLVCVFRHFCWFIQVLAQVAALLGIRSPPKKILQELASAHCTDWKYSRSYQDTGTMPGHRNISLHNALSWTQKHSKAKGIVVFSVKMDPEALALNSLSWLPNGHLFHRTFQGHSLKGNEDVVLWSLFVPNISWRMQPQWQVEQEEAALPKSWFYPPFIPITKILSMWAESLSRATYYEKQLDEISLTEKS